MRYDKKYLLPLFALCCICGSACNSHNGSANNEAVVSAKDTAPHAIDPANTTIQNDTLIIDRKAAVFFEPDSLQIEKRKAAIGEDNFFIGVEDYAYYLSMSHDYLDSARLRLLDARGKRFLKFIGNQPPNQIIRLDTVPELWGIYFFEPAKKAKRINMTMIEEEYRGYFD